MARHDILVSIRERGIALLQEVGLSESVASGGYGVPQSAARA